MTAYSRCCIPLLMWTAAMAAAPAAPAPPKLVLDKQWRIQSSSAVAEKGPALSTAGYRARDWYRVTAPSTVFAGLVANRVYPDPYFGTNLRSVPGVTYPVGVNFSNIPMPPESAFRVPWWYRTEFTAPSPAHGRRMQLHFDGINFRANVWLNGRQVAAADTVAGAWRLFEFDVTDLLIPGQVNALAVEVFPPAPNDLAITFVDWNPLPPDKGMGIWRDVYLTESGPVTVRFPNVVTSLNLPAADKARLTVTAELENRSPLEVAGTLRVRAAGVEVSTPLRLKAGERRVAELSPKDFPALEIAKPRLWWPVFYGPQNLYDLEVQFETGGQVSHSAATRFGIREVTAEIDAQKHLRFKVNGKNILIRGAGWSMDMLLRESRERLRAEMSYVRDLNLNAIRLEGKIESDEFLRMADESGILVMAGWCCCDHWENWQDWDAEDRVVAAESLRDQIRRLRSHPAVFTWLNGSDNPPPASVENMYIGILKELQWPNPYQSSATAKLSEATGPTGMKMNGPYEYVAPSYWLLDKTRGGAHGFATEVGPGPAVPPIESLERMLPEDKLWPINPVWDYHAGGGAFSNLRVFTEALNARYGKSSSAAEYARKAQAMAYEGERAMFEAFGARKYTATGVIQWMLNNAWPSMIWHLYDYYLRPGGSYFGAKKGCEPLHIQYSYDDRSVVVVNSYNRDFTGLSAAVKAFDSGMSRKFARDQKLDIAADGVQKLFEVPQLAGVSGTWFLSLELRDAAGALLSSNFYWLPATPEVLDWDNSTWYHTPTKTFSDLTALNSLPRVDLAVTASSRLDGSEAVTRVTVENPSRNLAFQVRLKVSVPARDPESSRQEILPVRWEDNYLSLLPGEKRTVEARYSAAALKKASPAVEVEGWNVAPREVSAAVQP